MEALDSANPPPIIIRPASHSAQPSAGFRGLSLVPDPFGRDFSSQDESFVAAKIFPVALQVSLAKDLQVFAQTFDKSTGLGRATDLNLNLCLSMRLQAP